MSKQTGRSLSLKREFIKRAARIMNKTPKPIQNLVLPLKIKYQFRQAENVIPHPSLLTKRSREFQEDIIAFWQKNLGININPAWHFIYANFTGKEDVRFLPDRVWLDHIHYALNDPIYQYPTFRDKNFTDFIIDKKYLPETVFKVVRGRFYDDENRGIGQKEAFLRLHADEEDKILKPSKGMKGFGIQKLKVAGKKVYLNEQEVKAKALLEITGEDAIVQYRVRQHPKLAEVQTDSLNTFRICTLRLGSKIHILSSIQKFGGNHGLVDNSKSGYLRNVQKDGTLGVAYDRKLTPVKKHATTGFEFHKLEKIPAFDQAVQLCKRLHETILHLDFAGWDVAVTHEGKPLIIEVNSSPPMGVFQLISQCPFFGGYTEKVLHFARKKGADIQRRRRLGL